jgi:hypothetical protein
MNAKLFGFLSLLSSIVALVQKPTGRSLQTSKIHVASTSIGESSKVAGEEKKSSDQNILLRSSSFGDLYRIRMPGEDDEDPSFVGAMGVPTFASTGGDGISPDEILDTYAYPKARGLEGVINPGPAFILDNVLSSETCEKMIKDCEQLGFGNYKSGKNHHGAMQILVSSNLVDIVGQALGRHIDVSEVESRRQEMMGDAAAKNKEDARLVYAGLNRRWRIYKYDAFGNETFAPHIDAGFPPSGLSEDGRELIWDASDSSDAEIVSRLTVLMYLNDDFVGGETNFYQPASSPRAESQGVGSQLIASVRPVAGSVLVFPQGVGENAVEYARKRWPLHEGSPVLSGRPKYVIRSDILFATQKEALPLEDKLFRYDHLVRQAFLSTSPAMDRHFLSHLSSLYNPHMGVENLGPLLYSFIRFTKRRRIVEIGAGYTSLWILQALKENDEELERIRELQRDEKCRLLDYPFTIPPIVENFDKESASLLCIDNCAHQKETATGATAVAKSLGLDSYMEFMKGDAFELELGENSVDILWCDFGVGARMREFVSSNWFSIRPGGFLLCHSTLTNQNTRDWLEGIRARAGVEITGIPPNEYVEISLLEPHKRYQNSISILQKRSGASTTEYYEEPIYSKYA